MVWYDSNTRKGKNIGTFFKSTLGIFAVIALIVLVVGGGFAMRVILAEPIGRGEAHIQIQSAEHRLSAYNYFYNMCAAIQASEHAIDAQHGALATATDNHDRSRINQNIAALNANRGRSIAEYNSDASKDYTVGQFRDSDLPYQIPNVPYEVGGEKTSCS